MRRGFLAFLGLMLIGCGGGTPPNGTWEVVSIDGKPVPTGVMMLVIYNRGGDYSVSSIGDAEKVASLKPDAIKTAMDGASIPEGGSTLTIKVNGQDVGLKKK